MTLAVARGRLLRLVPLLAAGALMVASLCGAGDPVRARQYFQQGRVYHTGEGGVRADPEKALRFYLQALKIDPRLFEAHVNAGKLYFARQDYRRCKYHLNEAIKLARGREDLSPAVEARVSSDLGGCFYKDGDLEQAEKWFRGAIALDPRLVEAHYNLINLLLAEDRQGEARKQLQLAAGQAPSTRYGIFEGRLRTHESYAEWNPLWLKVAIGGALGGAAVFSLLRWLRGARRGKKGP